MSKEDDFRGAVLRKLYLDLEEVTHRLRSIDSRTPRLKVGEECPDCGHPISPWGHLCIGRKLLGPEALRKDWRTTREEIEDHVYEFMAERGWNKEEYKEYARKEAREHFSNTSNKRPAKQVPEGPHALEHILKEAGVTTEIWERLAKGLGVPRLTLYRVLNAVKEDEQAQGFFKGGTWVGPEGPAGIPIRELKDERAGRRRKD